MNITLGTTYVSSYETNKHALPIVTTKSREIQYSFRFSQMFHCRFANANTSFCLCKSNQEKVENMEIAPTNTHTPSCIAIKSLPDPGTGIRIKFFCMCMPYMTGTPTPCPESARIFSQLLQTIKDIKR